MDPDPNLFCKEKLLTPGEKRADALEKCHSPQIGDVVFKKVKKTPRAVTYANL